MTSYRTAVTMLCLLLLSFAGLSVAAQDEKGFVRINPEDVQWKDAPVA